MNYHEVDKSWKCSACEDFQSQLDKKYFHCLKGNFYCTDCFGKLSRCQTCNQSIEREMGAYSGNEICLGVRIFCNDVIKSKTTHKILLGILTVAIFWTFGFLTIYLGCAGDIGDGLFFGFLLGLAYFGFLGGISSIVIYLYQKYSTITERIRQETVEV